MLGKFHEHVEKNNLLRKDQTILLGFSAGADSTCLLHMLNALGFNVVAAHLNHLQRPEAEAEADQCAQFCDNLGIPIVVGNADVPRMTQELKIGIEEAGRSARYAFFSQSAYETGADVVVTAHTLDDHIETILFQMARGSGLSGLAGIPERRGNIVRPLLPFRRSETQAYCNEIGLNFLSDPGNDNEEFSRVRLRQRIIPEFEAVHPGFFNGLLRLSQTATEEDEFLDGMAARILEQCECPLNGNLAFLTAEAEVCLQTTGWTSFPPTLAKRSIRLLAKFFSASLDFDQTQAIHSMILSDSKGSLTAEGGSVVFEMKPGVLHVRELQISEPFRFPLTFPGETESEVFGWKITAESWNPTDFVREPQGLDAILDQSCIKGGMYLTHADSSLKMTPLHGSSVKSVRTLLKTRSLTAAAKARLPIICDLVGPIWIPGVALADRCKVTETTNRAIRLMLGPLKNAGS